MSHASDAGLPRRPGFSLAFLGSRFSVLYPVLAMPNPRRSLTREDALLVASAALLGLAADAAFAAYRAVSAEGGADRVAAFAANLFWPGVLIVAGVGAAVWFGWKANID